MLLACMLSEYPAAPEKIHIYFNYPNLIDVQMRGRRGCGKVIGALPIVTERRAVRRQWSYSDRL